MENESGTTATELTAVIVIGGLPPVPGVVAALPKYDLVIAADSGLHGAIALGLKVDAVIGDMDSVDPTILNEAQYSGIYIERSPREKDNTDTELALLYAVARGATRIVLVTGGGGRLDHQLGVLNVLLHPKLSGARVEMFWDIAHVIVVRGGASANVTGQIGEQVGLLAVGGAATGITTSGLRWALDSENLASHSTRGVSNELVEATATVSLQTGNLFIIKPNALEVRNEK